MHVKPGSTYSGNAWTSIANDLCAVEKISFTVNQKSVRDGYRLLLDKHKKKMRVQESESGSITDETDLQQINSFKTYRRGNRGSI